jgi:aspartokinase-like uncharacterized kinase
MKNKVVIKIGGSLEQNFYKKSFAKKFRKTIKGLKQYKVLIIPGGGKFVNLIREIDKKVNLPPLISDKMAIIGMDLYGFFLSYVLRLDLTYSLTQALKRKLIIFLPSRFLFKKNPLKKSWDVTSDSISAYIAKKVKAKLILLKDVDGIYTKDPKKYKKEKLLKTIRPSQIIGKETCVDDYLPKFLLRNPLEVYIVNGKHPERIKEVLEGNLKIGTIIKNNS